MRETNRLMEAKSRRDMKSRRGAVARSDKSTSLERPDYSVTLAIRVISILSVLAAMYVGGCQAPAVPPSTEQRAPTTPVSLSSGDVVKLFFPGAPELNQSQKIRSDGKINLPLVGEVDAAGKSVPALQADLASRYKPQLKDATVLVTLESSVAHVIVSGSVNKPTTLTLDRPTTVFQAIMQAGGASGYGNLRKVHLTRVLNGEQQTQVVDLSSTLGGRKTQPIYVKDGDVIFVPQSLF